MTNTSEPKAKPAARTSRGKSAAISRRLASKQLRVEQSASYGVTLPNGRSYEFHGLLPQGSNSTNFQQLVFQFVREQEAIATEELRLRLGFPASFDPQDGEVIEMTDAGRTLAEELAKDTKGEVEDQG